MKYIQSILYSFTTWILASILNGLACGIYLLFAVNDYSYGGTIIIAIGFSFIISIPGIFLFWIYFVVCLFHNNAGRKLFIQLVNAAFISGLISAALFYFSLGREFPSSAIVMSCFGVIAAVTTVFIHRSTLLTVFKTTDNENSL